MKELFAAHIGRRDAFQHQAFLIEGGEDVLETLIDFLTTEHGIIQQGNPNVFILETLQFTIEDARLIAERQAQSGFGEAPQKIFITSFGQATVEAQNALLKVLEEPTLETRFFFVTPDIATIVPTIISRLRVVKLPFTGKISKSSKFDFETFFDAAPARRIKMCAALIKDKSKSRTKQFLYDLEIIAARKLKKQPTPELADFIENLPRLKQYAGLRGASQKQLIEYVCLRLPIEKLR